MIFGKEFARAGGYIKRLVLDTPVEIAAGAALGAVALGVVSHDVNQKAASEIPTAFSEIEHITQTYQARGESVPALTQFYAANNDIAMKVFESSNTALAVSDDPELFARDLQRRMGNYITSYTPIVTYTQTAQRDAQAALDALKPVSTAATDLKAVYDAFYKTWDESHIDHYRTEIYFETVCTGSGETQSCSQQMRTRQVYDYTMHYYDYDARAGAHAAQVLSAFAEKHPDVNIGESLATTDVVHRNNLEAITASMQKILKGEVPSQEEAVRLANTWARGSTLERYMPEILSMHSQLMRGVREWDVLRASARDVSYRTYSHYDSGPAGYQKADEIMRAAQTLNDDATKITSGIAFSASASPALESQIRDFIDVALNGEKGNAGKMRDDIMQLARDIYNKNHENGFDVQPYKWYYVALFTFLGLLGGAALGAGVDRVIAMPRIRDIVERLGEREFGDDVYGKRSKDIGTWPSPEKKFPSIFDKKEKPPAVVKAPEPEPAVEPKAEEAPTPAPKPSRKYTPDV